MVASAIKDGNPNLDIIVSNYLRDFITRLFEHKIEIQTISTIDDLNNRVLEGISHLSILRDELLNVISYFSLDDNCMKRIKLVDFFGSLLQRYEDEGISLFTGTGVKQLSCDHYRFFNQSFFISLTALLIENKCFITLANLVQAKFLVNYRSFQIVHNVNFIRFREYNYTLNQNINKSAPQRVSVTADYIIQQSNAQNIEKLIKADILLYYLSLKYRSDEPLDMYWYPELSVYNRTAEALPFLISRHYFEEVKVIFGVQSVEEFKDYIENVDDSLPRDNIFFIPKIKYGLSFDKVASKE